MIAIKETYTNRRPLAVCPMGIGHSKTLPHGNMVAQVPCRGDRLLHQMDRGKTIGHYHREKRLKFRQEKYHLPLWNP